MKKIVLITVLITVLIFALTACNGVSEVELQKLNDMTAINYDEIVINVTTAYNDNSELTNTFVVRFETDQTVINYTVRQFAELSLDNFPSDQIEEKIGVATLKNGKVSVLGDEMDLPFENIAKIPFDFQSRYFKAMMKTRTNFYGSVTNCAGFFGVENFDGEEMTVNAYYYDDILKTVTVHYTSGDAAVTVAYTMFVFDN